MDAEDKFQHYFTKDSYDFWKKIMFATNRIIMVPSQKLPVVCSKHNFLPVRSSPVWSSQSDPIRSRFCQQLLIIGILQHAVFPVSMKAINSSLSVTCLQHELPKKYILLLQVKSVIYVIIIIMELCSCIASFSQDAYAKVLYCSAII